jgi:anti-sigma regulatory factor (Ser/Thr protein kinase)
MSERPNPCQSPGAIRLPSGQDAAERGRAAIEQVSQLETLDDLRFTAQLLTSELIANAVQHPGHNETSVIQLAIECDRQMLRVEVADNGFGFNPLATLQPLARHTRDHYGIDLVNAMADRWGYRRSRGQFTIWFELDLIPGRRLWHGREPARPAS